MAYYAANPSSSSDIIIYLQYNALIINKKDKKLIA